MELLKHGDNWSVYDEETGYVVAARRMNGTKLTRISVYAVPAPGTTSMNTHITHMSAADLGADAITDAKWLGQVGMKRLPDDLDALPSRTEERARRVKEWHDANYARAHEQIRRALEFMGIAPIRMDFMGLGEATIRP